MKPGGQRQVKAPMVLTQKNWQLCCLEVHSSRSVAQMVPGLRARPGWDRGLPRGTILEMVPYTMQWESGERSGISPGLPQRGGMEPRRAWGRDITDITSAGPAVFLQQVAAGAGTQEAALRVFAEEGARCGSLDALVHI